MYSPEDEAAARTRADLHARIRIERAEPTRGQPGQCLLEVEVLDAWRAPAGLSRGDRIRIWVDSCWRGQRSPPGEDVRLPIEDLQAGAQLDVHAASIPGGAGREFAVLLGLARGHSPT